MLMVLWKGIKYPRQSVTAMSNDGHELSLGENEYNSMQSTLKFHWDLLLQKFSARVMYLTWSATLWESSASVSTVAMLRTKRTENSVFSLHHRIRIITEIRPASSSYIGCSSEESKAAGALR
jgi:hypothetical protein